MTIKFFQMKKHSTLLIISTSLIFGTVIVLFTSYLTGDFTQAHEKSLKTKYEVRHLGGDYPDLWPAWKLTAMTPLTVEITNPSIVSKDKISIIEDAILSKESKESDSSLMQVTADDSFNHLYKGWKGALAQAAKHKTTYQIPMEFVVTDPNSQESDIIITLTKTRSTEGYSGYTTSMSENNHILKSEITIYDIDNLTDEQLATITRHELGHALGLSHADEPDDLMNEIVHVPSFISKCDIDGIVGVYNAERNTHFSCGLDTVHKS